jgi:hypothetical protein
MPRPLRHEHCQTNDNVGGGPSRVRTGCGVYVCVCVWTSTHTSARVAAVAIQQKRRVSYASRPPSGVVALSRHTSSKNVIVWCACGVYTNWVQCHCLPIRSPWPLCVCRQPGGGGGGSSSRESGKCRRVVSIFSEWGRHIFHLVLYTTCVCFILLSRH